MDEVIRLDGRTLSAENLARIAAGARVILDENAQARMRHSAAWFAERVDEGVLGRRWEFLRDSEGSRDQLIRAFVLGHCAGVGEPFTVGIVRAAMAARVNVLATGATGCRPRCAHVLIHLLNEGLIPVVPSQGSVGAAGDLAPLAHVMRVACGYGGEVWLNGRPVPLDEVRSRFEPMQPNEKEALSLINGATFTVAMGALVVARAEKLLSTAEAACALSFEVVRADLHCLSSEALRARRHPGGVDVAERIRARLRGSENCAEGRKPDPFSVRCVPAVLGAASDALAHVQEIVHRELNGACDNPLVLPGGKVIEAGNFHGAPIALAMDYLKVALTQVASIAERRIFRMTYGQLSGLPSFLLPGTGLNSGLMLAQYTAASLVSECKVRSHPASVDSIPTVQHHEDHVSMGPIAARGALAITEALADVLAIELLCGAQGLDFHLAGEAVDSSGKLVDVCPKKAGEGSMETWREVRSLVSRWTDDRVLHPELKCLGEAVRAGRFSEWRSSW